MNAKEIKEHETTSKKINRLKSEIDSCEYGLQTVEDFIKHIYGYENLISSEISVNASGTISELTLCKSETHKVLLTIQTIRKDDVMKAEKELADYQPGKE